MLQALAQGHRFGLDVMEVTGLPSGTVYPALRRLEAMDLVRSDWEEDGRARQLAAASTGLGLVLTSWALRTAQQLLPVPLDLDQRVLGVVTLRRREIAVRMALGADTESVLRMIFAQALTPVIVGILGAGGAGAIGQKRVGGR